jgi:hypothetical protein
MHLDRLETYDVIFQTSDVKTLGPKTEVERVSRAERNNELWTYKLQNCQHN